MKKETAVPDKGRLFLFRVFQGQESSRDLCRIESVVHHFSALTVRWVAWFFHMCVSLSPLSMVTCTSFLDFTVFLTHSSGLLITQLPRAHYGLSNSSLILNSHLHHQL